MPKVSVVITAYNSLAYLPETTRGVFNQTFADFEVLIVDDGSSDETVQWAAQLVDPRVKLISQTNQGVSVARNTGIAHAQGEYIAFLDADDLWEPTKLEKQVCRLEENSAFGLVHTWLALMDEQSQLTGRVLACTAEGDLWQQIIEGNVVACSSAMVRRCCFETLGVFDTNLRVAEDWDMWIRIAAKYQFSVVKEPLVRYRQHPNSKSKNYPVMLADFRTIIEKAFQSVPFELLYLRNRSYGRVNLCIAWKCLQSSNKDDKGATHFCQQALLHYPQLLYSWDYIRLSLAIQLVHRLGAQGYNKALLIINNLRRHVSSMA